MVDVRRRYYGAAVGVGGRKVKSGGGWTENDESHV